MTASNKDMLCNYNDVMFLLLFENNYSDLNNITIQ